MGVAGVHSFGSGIVTTTAPAPSADATFFPPSEAVTRTCSPSAAGPDPFGSTRSVPALMSHVKSRSWMKRSGTVSSHTVCQMPVTRVYQMPPGCSFCLPCSWKPSVASSTRTSNSLPPAFNALVMSNENGVNPPRWLPIFWPLTQTVAS